MNQEDIKIRKLWLILVLVNLLNLLPGYFFIRNDSNLSLTAQWVIPSIMIYVSAIYFAFSYLLYRCAYKKPGTKFLTFILVSCVLSWISMGVQWARGSIDWNTPFHWTINVIQQILGICWFFLTWKMRVINKKLKSQLQSL